MFDTSGTNGAGWFLDIVNSVRYVVSNIVIDYE